MNKFGKVAMLMANQQGDRQMNYDRPMNYERRMGYDDRRMNYGEPHMGYDDRRMGYGEPHMGGKRISGEGWIEYEAPYSRMEPPESRRRRDSRGRYMQYGHDPRVGYEDEMRGDYGGERRMMGFEPGKERRDHHMEEGGYFFRGRDREGSRDEKLDMKTSEEWVRQMKNSDGTVGPHWNTEQIRMLCEQKPELKGRDLAEVYAVMNMLYSDYGEVIKKHGAGNIDFYVAMTKAWLDDEDAGPGKTRMYYECIAK